MKIVFASDFDGTISLRDFYWIVIDKYLGKDYIDLYIQWQDKKIKDVDFLNIVFNNINKDYDTIMNDIISIPVDKSAIEFIKWFTSEVGDFYVVSAGCKYYIDILMEKYGVSDLVKVIANPGYYKDGNIYMVPDNTKEYYSEIFGVDKGKAVEIIKRDANFLFFAGDSRPDYYAAKVADYVFAKHQLADMLKNEGISFFEFKDFSDIYYETKKIVEDLKEVL
ncbi:MAG: MtnX-like HAD-IB family phosphatase [Brevinematales bacterium]|nr:MtnX-like HAD-IB family phosphatase [Brevinematales bacterium]